jgi:hypothetical protein
VHASHGARARARGLLLELLQKFLEAVARVLHARLGRQLELQVELCLCFFRFGRDVKGLWLVHVASDRHQANDVRARALVALAVKPVQLQAQMILDRFAQHVFSKLLHREFVVHPGEFAVKAKSGRQQQALVRVEHHH